MPCSLFPVMTSEIIEDSIQYFAMEEDCRTSHFMTNYSPTRLIREEAEGLNLACKIRRFMVVWNYENRRKNRYLVQ